MLKQIFYITYIFIIINSCSSVQPYSAELDSSITDLWGLVTDSSGNGIPDVSVFLKPNNFSVLTDSSGIFSFESLKHDSVYTISLSKDGYNQYNKNIKLKTGETNITTIELIKTEGTIVLCFDDYYSSWLSISSEYLEYNAAFTFFVNGQNGQEQLITRTLITDGHTIGNHTVDHVNLATYSASVDREKIYQEQIVSLDKDIDSIYGVSVDCFAYPFGVYDYFWDRKLERSYRKVRRFGTPQNMPYIYTEKQYEEARTVMSPSLDNVMFTDDLDFTNYVDKLVKSLKETHKSITILTCHAIGDQDMAIKKTRIDYLVKKASHNGISFKGM